MTREEAIKWFIKPARTSTDIGEIKEKEIEAYNMTIEALQAEPNKAVPPSLADVYKWERDIALSQLEEYGIGFAEKKRDDLVEVVRCKDCRWYSNNHLCEQLSRFGSIEPLADFYCAFGERREP